MFSFLKTPPLLALLFYFSVFLLSGQVEAADRLHLWVKAFIPNAHPSRPSYVRKLPGSADRWVIPGPTIPWTDKGIPLLFDTCFETDNRGFSEDPSASARATSEVVLVYDQGTISQEKASGRDFERADYSNEVDCNTGSVKATSRADVSDNHFGAPAIADGQVQIILNARTKNPLTPRFGTPSIDYGGSFIWTPQTRKLRFKGYTGVFPAFEAYASLNDGPPTRLFGLTPQDGTSTWYLYDFSLMINTRSFIAELDLSPGPDTPTSSATTTPVVPPAEIERQVFVAKSKFQSSTTEPNALMLTAVANGAATAGRSPEEIKIKTGRARDVLDRHSSKLAETGLDIGLSRVSKTRSAARALLDSGAVSDIPLQAELNDLVGALSQSTLDQLTGVPLNGELSSKHPFLALDEFERHTFGSAFDRYLSDDHTGFKATYDDLLKAPLDAVPGDGVDKLVAAGTRFSDQPLIRQVAQAISSSRDSDGAVIVSSAFNDAMKGVLPTAAKSLRPLLTAGAARLTQSDWGGSDASEVALQALGDLTGFDAKRVVASGQSLQDGINVGNVGAVLYLAETFIGVGDPKLAREVHQVGAVAVQIAQAYSAYSSGANLSGLAMNAGAAGMTGNMVGVAFMLSGMAGGEGGAGAGSDPAVMNALQEIQQQMATIRAEMNARFDRVDKELSKIYSDTMKQFDLIRQAIAGVQADVTAIRQELVSIDRRLLNSELRIVDAVNKVRADLIALQLEPCLAWRETTVIYDMPPEMFVRCLSQFSKLATAKTTLQPVAFQSLSTSDLKAAIPVSRPPTETLPFLAAIASGAGHPLVSDATLQDVMSPEEWIAAASSYLNVAQGWPTHYRGTPLSQLKAIIERGRFLIAATSAAMRPEAGGALIDGLLEVYKQGLPDLDAKVRSIKLNMDAAQVGPNENWTSSITPCPGMRNFQTTQEWNDAGLNVANSLYSMTVEGRRAARNRVGIIKWCVQDDNVREQSPTTKPLEVLVIGYLELPLQANQYWAERLYLKRRWLRTSVSYNLPWFRFVGGIVGTERHGDALALVKSAWPELRAQLESVDGDSAGELAGLYAQSPLSPEELYGGNFDESRSKINTMLEPILRTQQSVSNEIYAALALPGSSEVLDKTSFLTKKYVELVAPQGVSGNDLLDSMMNGESPLVTAENLGQLKASGVHALKLAEIADLRARAISGLSARSLLGGDLTNNDSQTRLAKTIGDLDGFLQSQIHSCAEGLRPVAACDVP
jgi:hypothetical protein